MNKLLLSASVVLALCAPALATDFKTKILQIDGKEIPISAEDKTPLTLGVACEQALIATNLVGDNPTPDEKTKRFWLAMKIHDAKQELTAEDVSLAKKVVGLAYGPLIVGRVTQLLDPASVPK